MKTINNCSEHEKQNIHDLMMEFYEENNDIVDQLMSEGRLEVAPKGDLLFEPSMWKGANWRHAFSYFNEVK